MKATVVEIQSSSFGSWNKGRRQISLKFDIDPDRSEILRLPAHFIGIEGLALDDEINVSFSVVRNEIWPKAS